MIRRPGSHSRLVVVAMLLSTLSACGNDHDQHDVSTKQTNAPFIVPVIVRDETRKPDAGIDNVMVVSAEYDRDYWSNRYTAARNQLLQNKKQRLQGVAFVGYLPSGNAIYWGPSEHGNLDLWPSVPGSESASASASASTSTSTSTSTTDRLYINWVARETVDGRTFYDNMTATLGVPASLNQDATLFLHFLPGNRVAADWFADATWDTPETQWKSLAPRQEIQGRLGPQRVAMKLINSSGRSVSRAGIEPASPADAEEDLSNRLPETAMVQQWSGGFEDVAAGSPEAPTEGESAECSRGHYGSTCVFFVVPPDGNKGARLKVKWLEQISADAANCERAEVDVPPYSLKRQVTGTWRTGDELANTVWLRLLPDHRASVEVRDGALASSVINASPVKASAIARTVATCGGKGEPSVAQCCDGK